MNSRDLHYLIAVAEQGHFGKAAELCHVSQPALSMQIKKLEEYLGVTLLERNNKSVLLTEAGVAIAERARSILKQIDELKDLAQAIKDPFSGELKLGVFPTLAAYLFPIIIPAISRKFPKLTIYLSEEKTDVLIEQLKIGKLHAAILALPIHANGIITQPLFEEEFLLAVSHNHPLAKRSVVNADILAHEKILLLDEGHCLREQVLSFCHQVNAAENYNFRATSLESLRHMIATGAGITLLPRLAIEGCSLAKFIPFNAPKPTRKIGMIWRSCTSKKFLLEALTLQIKRSLSVKRIVNVIEYTQRT